MRMSPNLGIRESSRNFSSKLPFGGDSVSIDSCHYAAEQRIPTLDSLLSLLLMNQGRLIVAGHAYRLEENVMGANHPELMSLGRKNCQKQPNSGQRTSAVAPPLNPIREENHMNYQGQEESKQRYGRI